MSLFLFRVFTSSYLANFSKTFSVDLIVFFKRAISSCPILGYLLGPCREGGYDFFSSEKMQTKTEIDKDQDHLFGLSMAETNTESQNGYLIPKLTYIQVPIKRVGPNKRVGWFLLNILSVFVSVSFFMFLWCLINEYTRLFGTQE